LRPNEDEIKTTTMEEQKSGAVTPTPDPPQRTQHHQPKSRQAVFEVGKKIKVIPEARKGQLNVAFLSTIPGVLKIAEVSVSFVAFVLSICSDRRSASAGWTEHLTFETMVVVFVLMLGYIAFPHVTLADSRTRDGLVVLELLFYGINCFFYFIALWLMVHLSASWTADGRGAAIMAAVLCAGLVALFAFEVYIKYKSWRGQDVLAERNVKIGQQHSPSVPPAPIQRQTNFTLEDEGHVNV